MKMIDIEYNIVKWRKDTFPNVTIEGTKKKLLEECCELIAAIVSGDDEATLEELVDVFISGASHVHKTGVCSFGTTTGTLTEATLKKMDLNNSRVFGKEDENGDRPRER